MKKVLAPALALCMIFALGTVAFAAGTMTQSAPNGYDENPATVLIKTDITDVEDTWAATIPADVTLAWNTTAEQSLTANVKGQISAGQKVVLEVKMPTTLDLGEDKLAVALAQDTPVTVTATANTIISGVDLITAYSISGYDLVPIGVYQGVATYTATQSAVA